MSTEIEKKISEGLVPQIQGISLENAKLNMLILEKESELKKSPLYMEVQNLKKTLADNEELDTKLRDDAKDMMLTS